MNPNQCSTDTSYKNINQNIRRSAEVVLITHLLINTSYKNPWITLSLTEIQELCSFSYRQGANTFIQRLIKRGMIEVDRTNKTNMYKLTVLAKTGVLRRKND